MAFGFNPFTGNFDLTGGGDAAPFAGQVDAYADLPLDSTAALNSRWLVKNNSGTWPFSTYKQAGIYIRVSTVGASRDTDYQFVGTLPSVMNDNEFLIYDDTDATKNLKFNVGANVPTASTVTLTAPSASGTIGFLQSVTSITVSSTQQLTAARNQRVLVNNTNITSGPAVYLPSTGNAEGDRLEVVHATQSVDNDVNVRTGPYDFTVSTSMGLNEQRTFIYTSGAWTVGTVESHTHAGLGPTFASSAFQVTEPSGLATNRLAFSLSGITAGTTRTLTVPNASGTLALTAQLTDTQIFTANGTWTKPAGAKMVHFIVIGGGGGGGSGRRDNAGTSRCGGGGGGGGGISVGWLNESAFGATEAVTVGAGGAGGAARTSIANGNAGSAGGASSIGSVIETFASAGGNGGAGTSAGGGGGAANSARIYGPDGTTGGGATGRADALPNPAPAQFLGPTGGGGGGGISSANSTFTGNVGGSQGNARTGAFLAGGTAAASTAGANGNSGGFNFVGTGGGGGSPDSSTGEGKNGGNGALYGGGGGGGSGSTDPNNSGAGGTGANGIVIITTYF